MISQIENPKCACGCGEKVKKYRKRWRKYIYGHNARTPEMREMHSKRMLKNKLFEGHSHTDRTKEKMSRNQTGSGNSGWNGGRTISYGGYITILCKDHPYADVNGRVKEERLIIEKILGRYLAPGETVHHRNKVKTDNRMENLELMTHHDHQVFHIKDHKPWKNVSQEGRERTAKAHKGKPLIFKDPKSRAQKISNKLKGRFLSSQHKESIRIAKLGTHPTDQTRRKMSKRAKIAWRRRKELCL